MNFDENCIIWIPKLLDTKFLNCNSFSAFIWICNGIKILINFNLKSFLWKEKLFSVTWTNKTRKIFIFRWPILCWVWKLGGIQQLLPTCSFHIVTLQIFMAGVRFYCILVWHFLFHIFIGTFFMLTMTIFVVFIVCWTKIFL